MNKLGVIEGLLFVAGDEGLNLEQISDILECEIEEVKELLLTLKKSYEEDNRGIRISYLGNAFKLTTKSEHKEYYKKLVENETDTLLSQAALETLAIIAYNQPITRVEIDELRGVGSTHILRRLLAKEFIKEVGKSTMPGRPNLYATTSEFLDYFGISDLKSLPELTKLEIQEEDKELFTSIYKEQ